MSGARTRARVRAVVGAGVVARALFATLLAAAPLRAQVAPPAAQDVAALVRRVLTAAPLIDGHNDLPWRIRSDRASRGDPVAYGLRGRARGHTDIPRLRAGMVGGQLWSVFVPCRRREPALAQREQIALARSIIAAYPEALGFATTADELERVFREGRVGSLLAIEGGHVIEGSLDRLREFAALGVRSMGLVHDCGSGWADAGLGRANHGGLSPFGVEVVKEMNRLGVLVDLAHTSDATVHDALDVTAAPVIWSHAGVRAKLDHLRNVPDDVLRRLPANGGVVMIAFVPQFLARGRAATLADVADQIEHVRAVAGVDHVGLGADFDGFRGGARGLEDVSTYPALLAELARRGWSEAELAKLAGGNFMRVLRAAEETARRLTDSSQGGGR